ncbi:MAG: SRPBCC family protein [Acidimicrobiales bacterium]
MTTIRVRAHYPEIPAIVWNELRVIERHVTWMADARSLTFETDQHEGVGTAFRVRTKVGPFATTDRMTITRWVPNRVMGVEHRGLVRGTGQFTLQPDPAGTEVTWEETLHFPWWFAGPLGAAFAAPMLRSIWSANLARLGELI